MRPVLVDTNVLIDVVTSDEVWGTWSATALEEAHESTIVVINPIVYGEVSVGLETVEAVEAALPEDLYVREGIPFPAAFLAGRAYAIYRRRGGTRDATLPDFFIGAHAAVAGYRLLTRDPSRYRMYFPSLDLIAPS